MTTMNISLPAPMREYIEAQVTAGGYQTASEYVRYLVRRDQDRTHLRGLLLDGAQSDIHGPADAAYFSSLRSQIASDEVRNTAPKTSE